MSLHPALEHARDGLLARRGLREKFGHHVTARAQHEPLQAAYQHPPLPTGEDHREWVVPVAWQCTRSRAGAHWVKGMFANQNSACKLRNRFTLEQLATAFDLEH